ncbi:hypothetical protein GJAV_G00053260 [Gymnothorax javanicus]|nr:hypothetical protein GJAV_G00053260 [Gymnothorax javanicus]
MADEQLLRVRKEFVDRASRDVIMQLLDDLLEDGILNDGEKDALIEENRTTANRARCLIDKVRKKGSPASQALINRLQNRDPALFEELNLDD